MQSTQTGLHVCSSVFIPLSTSTLLSVVHVANMGGTAKGPTSLQSFLRMPQTSPVERPSVPPESDHPSPPTGDGFTPSEVQEALKPNSMETWQPTIEYAERDIRDLCPGPGAIVFTGRVAGLHDAIHIPKTPQSAKGCVKLCVKDDTGAITVSMRMSGLLDTERSNRCDAGMPAENLS